MGSWAIEVGVIARITTIIGRSVSVSASGTGTDTGTEPRGALQGALPI
jgi:hypothetical protein